MLIWNKGPERRFHEYAFGRYTMRLRCCLASTDRKFLIESLRLVSGGHEHRNPLRLRGSGRKLDLRENLGKRVSLLLNGFKLLDR